MNFWGAVHPTASAEKAKVEYEKEPAQDGDLMKARVKVFYKGLDEEQSRSPKSIISKTRASSTRRFSRTLGFHRKRGLPANTSAAGRKSSNPFSKAD